MIGLGGAKGNVNVSFSQRGDTTISGSLSLSDKYKGLQVTGSSTTNGSTTIGANYNPSDKGPRQGWNIGANYDINGGGLSGSLGYTDPGSKLGITSTVNRDGLSTSTQYAGVNLTTNDWNGFRFDEINWAEQNINLAQDKTDEIRDKANQITLIKGNTNLTDDQINGLNNEQRAELANNIQYELDNQKLLAEKIDPSQLTPEQREAALDKLNGVIDLGELAMGALGTLGSGFLAGLALFGIGRREENNPIASVKERNANDMTPPEMPGPIPAPPETIEYAYPGEVGSKREIDNTKPVDKLFNVDAAREMLNDLTSKHMGDENTDLTFDTSTRDMKLKDLEGAAAALEADLDAKLKDTTLSASERKAINAELASLKKTQIELEAKIRSQERTPLVDHGGNLVFTQLEIKYEVKIPTSEQVANLKALSETYKNSENNSEYKKIQSEVQKQLSETPEMKALEKAKQGLNDSVGSLQAYAESYARQVEQRLMTQGESNFLMKEKAKLVENAQAELKKAQASADKLITGASLQTQKLWLEKNGFQLAGAKDEDIRKLDSTLRREGISETQANKYIAEFNEKGYINDNSSLVNVVKVPTRVESMEVGQGQGGLSKIYREGPDGKQIEVRYPVDIKTYGLAVTYPFDSDTHKEDGGRTLPITDPNSKKINHDGIDIGMGTGRPLGSVGKGKVIEIKNSPESFLNGSSGKGASVTVEYGKAPNTVRVIYGHLSNINVKFGEDVNPGDLIGLSGNSGHSTAPHLHFTIIGHNPETFDWSKIE
ncbi:M23 family metallopeptidase [Leptospira idonii]|nr:peptidoglycan DD-metalloendopeptidase family protein [Leptospira idonii]